MGGWGVCVPYAYWLFRGGAVGGCRVYRSTARRASVQLGPGRLARLAFAAWLIRFMVASPASADDVFHRNEFEFVMAEVKGESGSPARILPDGTIDATQPWSHTNHDATDLLVRGRKWAPSSLSGPIRLGVELRLGMIIHNFRSVEHHPGVAGGVPTVTSEGQSEVHPRWHALLLADWSYLSASYGLASRYIWQGRAALEMAGHLRVGPRWLHLAAHLADDGWMMAGLTTESVGIGTDFEVPAVPRIGPIPFGWDTPLLVQAWVGSDTGTKRREIKELTNPFQVGVRIVGKRFGLRLAMQPESYNYFKREYGSSSAWSVGLTLPLD